MRKALLIFALLIISGSAFGEKGVWVKYRNEYVNVWASNFEYLNTDVSSFICGAWYDDDNSYMIICLNGTYYHYCGMPKSAWQGFKKASSFGRYYNYHIKGSYDCRTGFVPPYKVSKYKVK